MYVYIYIYTHILCVSELQNRSCAHARSDARAAPRTDEACPRSRGSCAIGFNGKVRQGVGGELQLCVFSRRFIFVLADLACLPPRPPYPLLVSRSAFRSSQLPPPRSVLLFFMLSVTTCPDASSRCRCYPTANGAHPDVDVRRELALREEELLRSHEYLGARGRRRGSSQPRAGRLAVTGYAGVAHSAFGRTVGNRRGREISNAQRGNSIGGKGS